MASRHLSVVADEPAIPPQMQRVLNVLKGVRADGPNKWMALCPAHDDYPKPSLSLRIGDVQPVLANCFAGCTWEEVFAALSKLGVGDKGYARRKGAKSAARPERTRPPDPLPSFASVCGWNQRLIGSAESCQYLHDRGLTLETIRAHLIGWNGR